MLNRPLSIFISFLLFLFVFINYYPVSAKNENKPELSYIPPEVEGTYDVPGRPNMKVRVFIHKAKDNNNGKPVRAGKPTPTPTSVPSPVCELDDPESSVVDGLTGWHLPVSWEYNLNIGSVPGSIGSEDFPVIVDNSVSAWTEAINNNVSVNRGTDTSKSRAQFDGINIVTWGRTSGSALGVAYTWYYTDTGQVAEVDTILNKSYPWSWTGNPVCAYPDSYDAQNILTHEVGHWFGTDDMYSPEFQHNTMFCYGSPQEAKKDTLTQGDKNSVNSIYPN